MGSPSSRVRTPRGGQEGDLMRGLPTPKQVTELVGRQRPDPSERKWPNRPNTAPKTARMRIAMRKTLFGTVLNTS